MLETDEWTQLIEFCELQKSAAPNQNQRRWLVFANDFYCRLTGESFQPGNYIWLVRRDSYGRVCPDCGKLYRTPRARYCAECGHNIHVIA